MAVAGSRANALDFKIPASPSVHICMCNRVLYFCRQLLSVWYVASLAALSDGLLLIAELSRNREFYRTTDIRPPFTYASLIRQVSTESYRK